MKAKILIGDVLTRLGELSDESVQCVVTSPPYWGLRNYGVAGQLGLEKTPEEYIAKMVAVFREVRRVLRSDGTCWVNMGDSYAGSGKGGHNGYNSTTLNGSGHGQDQSRDAHKIMSLSKPTRFDKINTAEADGRIHTSGVIPPFGVKPKDLVGIPWMLAFALRADGWWLRQEIIWAKPNPMPEKVTDRCTKSHESIFLLTKSAHYFYDAEAIKEPAAASSMLRWDQDIENQHGSERVPGKTNWPMKAVGAGAFERLGREGANSRMRQDRAPSHSDERKVRTAGNKTHKTVAEYERSDSEEHRTAAGLLKIADTPDPMRNKRSVWEIVTQPYAEAHFATFPEALVEPCILAGTSERGCCPACGAPWERVLAAQADYEEFKKTERERKGVGNSSGGGMRAGPSGAPGLTRGTGNKSVCAITETTGWQPTCSCALADLAENCELRTSTTPCVVLDPFCGSGTTGVVALRYHRDFVGIELNPTYAALAERRIRDAAPLLNQVKVISE